MIQFILHNWHAILVGFIAVLLVCWAAASERKATRDIRPGSRWIRKSSIGRKAPIRVEVERLDLEEGVVWFRYLGFANGNRSMTWASFLHLFGLLPAEEQPEALRPAVSDHEALTNLAVMLGMERRFWGFEPDFLLRYRLLKGMRQ